MTVSVLVADDSAFFRRRIKEILEKNSQIKIVGFADNGKDAVEKAIALSPDVITMDYEMPQMNGIMAVREIMARKPTPILMFSSLTYEGARVTLDALEAGAVDYLPKSFEAMSGDPGMSASMLQEKVMALVKRPRSAAKPAAPVSPVAPVRSEPPRTAGARATSAPAPLARPAPTQAGAAVSARSSSSGHSSGTAALEDLRKNRPRIVLIGASTGGPVALQKVLVALPANFPYPILLVQHMPGTFTSAFAERLNRLCQIQVKEAVSGDSLRPGLALLAPGGKQMLIDERGAGVTVSDGNDKFQYKPCVDVTFGSAARNIKGRKLAIVLTGMGADGREGCKLLKKEGAAIWTQDEDSCVVYGMPQAVEAAGLSSAVFSIDDIARYLKDV
ncbi:Protein-glutamate methylesterase [gamma proteobacterium HdN1]|nr:Protein-glutamate methylesterase [gamma proteobacterium HdN1]